MYKIITTKDNSHTIISPFSGDTYHSMGGAISESEYVYIENGLLYLQDSLKSIHELRILEIGFGTGLNCYLTRINQTNFRIHYTALEPYPLPKEVIESLNYKEIIERDSEFFDIIHSNCKGFTTNLNDEFYFEFINQNIESYESTSQFDLIYFDGFAQSKDNMVWSQSNISKISNMLSKKGIMVTYASNSYLKKALKQVGLEFEVLPGALGKREMIRAINP